MNETVKLMFDENVGRGLVRALAGLAAFHQPPPVVSHVLDFTGQEGEEDDVWIPKLAREKWVIISADQGHLGGAKLPLVCKTWKITHVLIKGKLHHARQFEKARAILAVWPELLEAAKAIPGTEFRLHYAQRTFVLEEKLFK